MSINGHVGEDFALSREDNRKKCKWLKNVFTEISVWSMFLLYLQVVVHSFVVFFIALFVKF